MVVQKNHQRNRIHLVQQLMTVAATAVVGVLTGHSTSAPRSVSPGKPTQPNAKVGIHQQGRISPQATGHPHSLRQKKLSMLLGSQTRRKPVSIIIT